MVLTSFKQTRTNNEQTFNETVEANDNIKNKRQNRRHDTTVTRDLRHNVNRPRMEKENVY